MLRSTNEWRREAAVSDTDFRPFAVAAQDLNTILGSPEEREARIASANEPDQLAHAYATLARFADTDEARQLSETQQEQLVTFYELNYNVQRHRDTPSLADLETQINNDRQLSAIIETTMVRLSGEIDLEVARERNPRNNAEPLAAFTVPQTSAEAVLERDLAKVDALWQKDLDRLDMRRANATTAQEDFSNDPKISEEDYYSVDAILDHHYNLEENQLEFQKLAMEIRLIKDYLKATPAPFINHGLPQGDARLDRQLVASLQHEERQNSQWAKIEVRKTRQAQLLKAKKRHQSLLKEKPSAKQQQLLDRLKLASNQKKAQGRKVKF